VMNETENHVSDHRKMDKTQSPDHVIKVGDGRRNRLDELSVYFRMAKLLIFAIALLVPMLTGIAAGQAGSQNQETYRLWAAMSVQQPVIPKNRVNNLTLTFSMVNDGDSTVNPGVRSSHLFINGIELKEWEFISSNGPKSSFDFALPPKRTLLFSYALGEYFKEPGIYNVRWQGDNFKASEITFRVLSGNL